MDATRDQHTITAIKAMALKSIAGKCLTRPDTGAGLIAPPGTGMGVDFNRDFLKANLADGEPWRG